MITIIIITLLSYENIKQKIKKGVFVIIKDKSFPACRAYLTIDHPPSKINQVSRNTKSMYIEVTPITIHIHIFFESVYVILRATLVRPYLMDYAKDFICIFGLRIDFQI